MVTKRLLFWFLTVLALVAWSGPGFAEEPFLAIESIFEPEPKHNHASCVVQCPNGDLLVAWYRGSGERQADDVQIYGARKSADADRWRPRFLMDDTPGYPDCNPALFVAPDDELWLFYPTILDHRWEGALLKYQVSEDYQGQGPPDWSDSGVFHVTPEGFAEAFEQARDRFELDDQGLEIDASDFDAMSDRADDLLYQRLGWMPRVHPTVLPSGRWLMPLYTDTFSASIIAISDDQGDSWQFSEPMIGFGNIQPSLVPRKDGTILAFMRDNSPRRRICTSRSTDQGETWSPVVRSELPNPGAGIEALRLQNGHWLLVYNDLTRGRWSLSVALSQDEGRTWEHSRRLAFDPAHRQSFHYPSVIQASDGSIHVSYTHSGLPEGSTIAHAHFNQAWVVAGDGSDRGRIRAEPESSH